MPASAARSRVLPGAPLLEPFHARLRTPFAVLGVRTAGSVLAEISYLPRDAATLDPVNRLAAEVCRQLERYIENPRFRFDLPVAPAGTEFQQRVWEAIGAIPCGQTLTYLDVARRIGSAPRPVGGACGANRIPLLIPCHRVVASHGIGGFMHARGGEPIRVKQWLLRHERA